MESILPYVAGPAAAVFVLLLVLFAIYKLTVIHILPIARAAIGRHLDQIDQLISSHDADRAAWVSQIQAVRTEMSGIARRCPAGINERAAG